MDLKEFIRGHNKTHLIFDFDETIFFLLLPWEDCMIYAEKDLRRLDPELYEKYGIYRWSELQNAFIKKHGRVAKEIFLTNNTRFETELLQGVKVNHELVEFINTAKDYHFYLWSSNTKPVIEQVLKQFGIHQKFEKIITRTDVDMLKPDPEGFEHIYNLSVPKEQYVMIGDSSAEMFEKAKSAAANAGIDFFPVVPF